MTFLKRSYLFIMFVYPVRLKKTERTEICLISLKRMPSTGACYMTSKLIGLIHLSEGVPIICQLCYMKKKKKNRKSHVQLGQIQTNKL